MSKWVALLGLLMAVSVSGCATSAPKIDPELSHGFQLPHYYQGQIVKSINVQYLLYLPAKYDEVEEWPMILYLHGSNSRGNNPNVIKQEGIANLVETRPGFRFIVLSPQCPSGESWSTDVLIALLDDIVANYKVNPRKIYLTGNDIGGYATWDLATQYPDRFAAIAPVSGSGNPSKVCALRDTPAWVFHGADDKYVRVDDARQMVLALKRCHGTGKFTVFPNIGHDAWINAYADTDLYLWFLEQEKSRGQSEAVFSSGSKGIIGKPPPGFNSQQHRGFSHETF